MEVGKGDPGRGSSTKDLSGAWKHLGFVWMLDEWWKRSWAHCEEHKKEFGFAPVGGVEPYEGFKQGDDMLFIGCPLRMLALPWENALRS